MTDTTFKETTSFYLPTLKHSLFDMQYLSNVASIPHYTRTSEDGFDSLTKGRSQVMGYESVEGCGSSDEPRNLYSHKESATSGGLWRSEYLEEPCSMDCTTDSTYWSEMRGYDYGMTGMEELKEAVDDFEVSNHQTHEGQAEFDAAQTTRSDPYSYTYIVEQNPIFSNKQSPFPPQNGIINSTTPGQSSTPRSSEMKQLSSSYRQIDNNVPRDRRQSQRKVTYSEFNYSPSTCLLEGCRGVYEFPTFQSYRTHLKNVHHKDIYCHVLECNRSRTRPFNSETDRRRHHSARHDPSTIKSFKCERTVCPARVKAWKRKDKLCEHNKKYHMQIPRQICSEHFQNSEELSQHKNFDHRSIIYPE